MTVGEFKQWLVTNGVPDDRPLWRPRIEAEGGLEYLMGWGGDVENAQLETATFGLALPLERQTQETGVILW